MKKIKAFARASASRTQESNATIPDISSAGVFRRSYPNLLRNPDAEGKHAGARS
jgi:hypothetical protein